MPLVLGKVHWLVVLCCLLFKSEILSGNTSVSCANIVQPQENAIHIELYGALELV